MKKKIFTIEKKIFVCKKKFLVNSIRVIKLTLLTVP